MKTSNNVDFVSASDQKSEEPGWKDIPEYRLELVRDRVVQLRKGFPNRYSAGVQNEARTVLHEMLDRSPVEQFVVLMLNTEYEIVGAHRVAIGGLESVSAHMTSVFRAAIVASVPRVVLCHCHPTGQARPSDADLMITLTAIEAGALLGIEVVDHIITSPDGSDYSIYDHQDDIDKLMHRKVKDVMTQHPIGMIMQEFIDKIKSDPASNEKQPSLSRRNPYTMQSDIIQEVSGLKKKLKGFSGN